MIKEPIPFKPGFPIDISINGINEYPKHWHESLEIICVLEGSVRIQDSFFSCCLTEGDIYIFNLEDLHSIYRLSETNIILSFHIDLDYFSKFFKDLEKMNFMCDSYITKNEIADELNHLRYLMSKILLELNSNNNFYTDNIEYYMKNLITNLIDNFQYFHYEMNQTHHHIDFKCEKKYSIGREQMERIHRIYNYIYEHYNENILLSDIAKLEYLSPHYLSYNIKKICGLSFQELLSLARVECAEKLLIDTDMKMDIIAVESGFSSRKYLNYHFKRWYKCTPSEYRKKNSKKDNQKSINKFVGYNKEKAYKKINEYLYGNQFHDISLNSCEKYQNTNYAKLLYASSEIYKYLLQNLNADSVESLIDLVNKDNSMPSTDYSTFLKNLLILTKKNTTDTNHIDYLLSLLDN